jgi:ligand-binding sensor domain-containing protein
MSIKYFSLVLLSFLFNTSNNLNIQATYSIADGLPNNEVRTIYVESDNSIWVGTSSGAAHFINDKWEKDIILDKPVITIFKDSKGNMWFGNIGEVNMYDGSQLKSFSIKDDMKLSGRLVFSIYEDEKNNIWMAAAGGAAMFDGTSWTSITDENGLSHNVVHDIMQNKDGAFWFATRKGGLNIYDGIAWKSLYHEKNCRKIFKDTLGNMWIGTGNNGILLYDGNQWSVFEEGKTVLPMFQGAKGYVWCIVDGKDIIRISPSGNKRNILYENPIKEELIEIFDIKSDHNGSIWAGTTKGVFVLH